MPRSDVRDWIGFLAWERGLSPRTREAYASDLRALAAFLAGDGAAGPAADPDRVDWRAVGTERLRGFLEEGVRAGLSEATRARRLVAVSMRAKKSATHTDRLSKYLARFGLKFKDLSRSARS